MTDLPDRVRPRFHAAAVVLLLALHLLLLVTSSWNQSLTYDEPDHLSFGLGYLKEGRLVEADAQRMPVTVLNALAFWLLTPAGTAPPRYEDLPPLPGAPTAKKRAPSASDSSSLPAGPDSLAAKGASPPAIHPRGPAGPPATPAAPIVQATTRPETALPASSASPGIDARTQRAHNLAGRLPTMLVSLLLGVAVLAWSTRLYGPTAGLLSLTLYVFCPNLIAHGRLITTDVYAAAAALAAAWAFRGLCRRPSAVTFVLSAATLGLAQAAKFSSVVLVPAFGLILLLPAARAPLAAALRGRPGRWAWIALYPLFACVALGAAYRFDGLFRPFAEFPFHSYFFAWLKALWPGLALPLPRVYLEGLDLSRYIDTHPGVIRGHNYLLGRLSDEGWWYYYLVVGLFKMPLGVLGLLGMRSVMALAGWRKGSGLGGQRSFPDGAFLLVPALAFLAFFSLFSSVQLGFRYVLPILPLAYVWAGGIVTRISGQAASRRSVIAAGMASSPQAGPVPGESLPGGRDEARDGPPIAPLSNSAPAAEPCSPVPAPLPHPPDSGRWDSAQPGRRIRTAIWGLAGAAALSSLLSFPDFIPYTNELILPKIHAYRILADSNLEWGQDRYYLQEYLLAHPDAVAHPQGPMAGHLVVRINLLTGVFQEERYAWLRERSRPDGRLHGSYLVYHLAPADRP